MALTSLTYLSTATQPFDEAALRELLEVSRANNADRGLTGVLLHADGHFIQTLEGPTEAVDAAFETISRDVRHRDVQVALREEVADRSFAGWQMGFESLALDEAQELPGFTDYLEHRKLPAQRGVDLARAGVFHRAFRDQMR